MLKIDIISGFLGAGKTTFIERLLKTNLKNEKVVLIENEYGEVSVDTDILKDTKIEIRELSQGCICCSLVGDFSKSLKTIIDTYNPDRILIEPSGVGKLSDIIKAVAETGLQENVNSLVCLVDAKKAKMYERNFGEFFVDQIESAHTVILSRTDVAKDEVIETAVEIVRKHNEKAVIVTTPINNLSDEDLIKAYEGVHEDLFEGIDLDHLHENGEECDDPNCCCHHHHHHDHEEDEHEHHHHHEEEEHEHHHHHDHDDDDDDDDECCCHHHDEEHHHHDHHEEEECSCHHHHDDEECDDPNCSCHDHHHHHHADEVFQSLGIETVKKYDITALKALLDKMAEGEYGIIVRSKGIIEGTDSKWYVFNLTPEEVTIEPSKAIPMGKIVVIGSKIDTEVIRKLF
ncbi:cobalamin synthesis protein cobW-like protein [Anaeroplasma bactoclasticum]|jgi:G3E family GTPase|uniref:Cobalamin synthesis protein cobW-like protein n=1 Tax=Anaeroplasma bactoclasticum TaxID=2088 RepID=A0A397S2P2_9MOLU|nr:CobW family GTP-binding protein [Anaeroplasma bactoclasticum]RIA78227.1 cobalamin synthesis protein cobW-like protein [Anaeroplasma bactoclasticum]